MRLDELARYLDEYLHVRDEVADSPEALNGLQIANRGDVTRVAAAVDVCEATVRMAGGERAVCRLVHHGLLWGGVRPLVGLAYLCVAGLIVCNLPLSCANFPLGIL